MPSSTTQTLHLTFRVPGRHPTSLKVEVAPNASPEKTGFPLLFPNHSPDLARGFPTCKATLHAHTDVGYAAMYGWLQTVLEKPDTTSAEASAAEQEAGPRWQTDPLPLTQDLSFPFTWFGAEPQLFDAPSRPDRSQPLDWTCQSFLAYVPDAVVSRRVCPVVGFEWGFLVEDGEVRVKGLKGLDDVGEAWEGKRRLWEGKFPGWEFAGLDPGVRVWREG